MAGRVQVIAPDGTRGTVDEKDVGSLPDGARVLSKQELAQERAEAEYASRSTAAKVGGYLTPALPAPVQMALHGSGAVALPPEVESYRQGASKGMTAGLETLAEKGIAGAIGGAAGGRAYVQRADDATTASPSAATAGEVVGFGAGMLAGGVGGAAGKAATPVMSGLGAVGDPIEHGVVKALGGLASKGTMGRAATQAAAMSVRGAVEGGAYAAIESGVDSTIHDDPKRGEKMFVAFGHGALVGGGLGAAIGFGGSLVGSATRGLGRAARATGEAIPPPELAPLGGAAPRGREVRLSADALDAGLSEKAPKGESPFDFGRKEVSLRGQGKIGKVSTDGPIDIAGGLGLDADAGIAKRGTGGAFQGKFATEPPLYTSEAKTARRRVGLRSDVDVAGPVEAASPIKLPWMEPAALDEVAGSLGKVDATGAAHRMAREQAWKAVGAGFGLQTTRYAKEAARYFPNGTQDLGEVALRYGLIDTGQAGISPTRAAWQAAKTGTAAEIAPKAATASDLVGEKIGAITQASGARVALSDIDRGIATVRGKYDRIAGNDHVVREVDKYAAQLRQRLVPGADGTTSIQTLLEQRKGLDDIVYRETKTLDPGRRVEALREVRSKLEGLITDALDEASGKVPGAQKAEYQALKKDYHALRILSEAAEDSAARASKGATLGLTDKIVGAAAGSAAGIAGGPIGGLVSGPAAAFASKLVRERGNAAAAAFLSRAAEQGMISRAVATVDAKIGAAARNVLRQGAADARARLPRAGRPVSRQEPITREQGRAAQAAKVREAQSIMKWAADHQANPDRLVSQIEEAAAIVGQHGGPKTSEAYTAATLRAINFIVGHIPAKERRDPLDPRSTPPLTYEEADKLVRADKYAKNPMTVWDDFERGKVTPEGIRAAKAFMPESYAEFQVHLMEHVQNHMLRNQKLTASQRLRVSKLLEFPAGPDLRPDTIRRLQANLMKAPEAPPPAGPMGAQPVNMQVQPTGFDAIEARAAG